MFNVSRADAKSLSSSAMLQSIHEKCNPQKKKKRGRNELRQFRFSFSGPFFQIWQFFVVLHKIGHECIMTLHGRFTKITKKSKHGNVYNDRSTKK